MASRNAEIAVTVKDGVTTKAKRIQKSIKQTGRAVQSTAADFTKFNRTMFATTAFVGLFTIAARRLSSAMISAATMDRVVNQFERTVGPKGLLFQSINNMTDTAIDRMEALRSGIALSSLGIMKDTGRIAEFIARAGTAAKLAGLESVEGVKRFTKFMKDGSVAHLEFLNLIRSTNPALLMQLSVLRKYGNIAGGALSAQQRLSIGQKLLFLATQNQLKGNRDLLDILTNVGQSFRWLGKDITMFLGEAFGPFLNGVQKVIFQLSNFFEVTRKNHKEIIFLVKAVTVATSAIVALVASVGMLRMSVMALGSLGIGVPALTAIISGLGLAFLGTTSEVDGFVNKLKAFGAIVKGSWELVSSFLMVPENYAKGIGQMDKATYDFLQKHNLLNLTKNLARVMAVVGDFGKGLYAGFVDTFKTMVEWVEKISSSITKLLGIQTKNWSKDLLSGARALGSSVGSLMAIMLPLLAFKGFRNIVGGVLGKVPVIGGFFGGKPKGTPSDPMWVKLVSGTAGLLNTIIGRKPDTKIPTPGIFATGLGKLGTKAFWLSAGTLLGKTVLTALAAGLGILIGEAINYGLEKSGAAKWLDKKIYNLFGKTQIQKSEALKSQDAQRLVLALKGLGQKTFSQQEIANKVLRFQKEIAPKFEDKEKAWNVYERMLAAESIGRKIPIRDITTSMSGMPRMRPITGEELEKRTIKAVPNLEAFRALGTLGTEPGAFQPEMTQENLKMYIQKQIKAESGQEQQRMENAYQEAIKKSSESGTSISAQEFKNIFKDVMQESLAPVQKATQETANNTIKSEIDAAKTKRPC